MNISPVRFLNIADTNYSKTFKGNQIKEYHSLLPEISKEQLQSEYPCNIEALKALININEPYKNYKPVASIKPYTDAVGNYEDLDKFCELYAKKINSNLLIPTENDIEKLVLKIKKATGADDKTVRNVLYNLCKYSEYKSFSVLKDIVDKFEIKDFGFPYKSGKFDFSSNGAINYLAVHKKFIEIPEDYKKTAFILDDSSLSLLEKYKNSSLPFEKEAYFTLLRDIYEDKIVFINLKGWEIKTKNNGYKSANFISGTGYLEDIAIEVVNRIKSGENPDDIYFSDYKDRLFDIIDTKSVQEHINVRKVTADNNLNNISNNDILNEICPPKIDKDFLKKAISEYMDVKGTLYPRKQLQTTLLKYLDEMTVVYSIDSLASALKKMGKNIETTLKHDGYSKENIIYAVPAGLKSYSLITQMYSKVNNIKIDNIVSLSDINNHKDSAKIILDDLSASGASEAEACYNVRLFSCGNKAPIIYSAVNVCSQAENNDERTADSRPHQYFFDKYQNDMSKINKIIGVQKMHKNQIGFEPDEKELKELISKNYKILNYEDCLRLNNLLFKGFNSSALCTAFPYMIPDNDSDLSALLFDKLLRYKNPSTNKPKGLLLNNKRKDYEYDSEKFKKIIKQLESVTK